MSRPHWPSGDASPHLIGSLPHTSIRLSLFAEFAPHLRPSTSPPQSHSAARLHSRDIVAWSGLTSCCSLCLLSSSSESAPFALPPLSECDRSLPPHSTDISPHLVICLQRRCPPPPRPSHLRASAHPHSTAKQSLLLPNPRRLPRGEQRSASSRISSPLLAPLHLACSAVSARLPATTMMRRQRRRVRPLLSRLPLTRRTTPTPLPSRSWPLAAATADARHPLHQPQRPTSTSSWESSTSAPPAAAQQRLSRHSSCTTLTRSASLLPLCLSHRDIPGFHGIALSAASTPSKQSSKLQVKKKTVKKPATTTRRAQAAPKRRLVQSPSPSPSRPSAKAAAAPVDVSPPSSKRRTARKSCGAARRCPPSPSLPAPEAADSVELDADVPCPPPAADGEHRSKAKEEPEQPLSSQPVADAEVEQDEDTSVVAEVEVEEPNTEAVHVEPAAGPLEDATDDEMPSSPGFTSLVAVVVVLSIADDDEEASLSRSLTLLGARVRHVTEHSAGLSCVVDRLCSHTAAAPLRCVVRAAQVMQQVSERVTHVVWEGLTWSTSRPTRRAGSFGSHHPSVWLIPSPLCRRPHARPAEGQRCCAARPTGARGRCRLGAALHRGSAGGAGERSSHRVAAAPAAEEGSCPERPRLDSFSTSRGHGRASSRSLPAPTSGGGDGGGGCRGRG